MCRFCFCNTVVLNPTHSTLPPFCCAWYRLGAGEQAAEGVFDRVAFVRYRACVSHHSSIGGPTCHYAGCWGFGEWRLRQGRIERGEDCGWRFARCFFLLFLLLGDFCIFATKELENRVGTTEHTSCWTALCDVSRFSPILYRLCDERL